MLMSLSLYLFFPLSVWLVSPSNNALSLSLLCSVLFGLKCKSCLSFGAGFDLVFCSSCILLLSSSLPDFISRVIASLFVSFFFIFHEFTCLHSLHFIIIIHPCAILNCLSLSLQRFSCVKVSRLIQSSRHHHPHHHQNAVKPDVVDDESLLVYNCVMFDSMHGLRDETRVAQFTEE